MTEKINWKEVIKEQIRVFNQHVKALKEDRKDKKE